MSEPRFLVRRCVKCGKRDVPRHGCERCGTPRDACDEGRARAARLLFDAGAVRMHYSGTRPWLSYTWTNGWSIGAWAQTWECMMDAARIARNTDGPDLP